MNIFTLLTSILLLSGPASAQSADLFPLDPVTYFCARWQHSSAVKNNILYINGGIETFNYPGAFRTNWTNNTLGVNTFLLEVDLTASWNWKTNISITALNKTANPKTGTFNPNFVRGTMFQGPANDSRIYFYGGTSFLGNESFLGIDKGSSNQYPLWSFNGSNAVWDQFDIHTLWRPSFGAAAEAPDQGLGFYLNGQLDNGTSTETLAVGETTFYLDGMMVIDLVNQTANNISTAGIRNYLPRIGGGMQYVPGVGKSGVLVALGGQVDDSKISAITKGRLLNFTTVDVFDIASYIENPSGNGTWYSQTTSGAFPLPRTGFCTIVASAPDNCSHNMCVHG